MNNKIIILILTALFLAIAIPRVLYPDLDHGDEWADAENLISGENYYKFGFLKTRFLPFFGIQDETLSKPYTHYPPLANIVSGVIRKVTNSDSLYLFRVVALFFSFFNLLFWYLFIKKFSGSNIFALLCGIFYASNPFFIYGVDALSQISYADFLRSLILFIFIITLAAQGRRKTVLFSLLWIALLLESLMTIEYLVYLFLCIVLYKRFFKVSREQFSWKAVFLLFTASVTGFLLHFLKNVWYFGSLSLALRDFKSIVLKRIAGSTDSPFPLSLATWWQHVIAKNFSLVFLYNYFILFLALFFFYLLYQGLPGRIKKETRSLFRWFIIVAVCGINWYILFPSHALAHTFIFFLVRHLLPVASVGFALFFYCAFLAAASSGRYKTVGRALCVFGVCFVAYAGIARSELPVTGVNIARARDFRSVSDSLLRLRAGEHPKGLVAVNYWRTPFISYYTGRKTIPIFSKQELSDLPSLPRYFIFFYRNDAASRDLLDALNQKYNVLFTCASARFPSVFFSRKD